MSILFESSIVKVDANGNRILSTTLEAGEKLVDGQTYEQIKALRNPAPVSIKREKKRGGDDTFTKNF